MHLLTGSSMELYNKGLKARKLSFLFIANPFIDRLSWMRNLLEIHQSFCTT